MRAALLEEELGLAGVEWAGVDKVDPPGFLLVDGDEDDEVDC